MPARKNTRGLWKYTWFNSLYRSPLKICFRFSEWERIKVGRNHFIHFNLLVYMSAKISTRTGQTAKVSGQYRPSGSRKEITLSKGDRVPPYSGEAKSFTLVDKTKHKR